MTDLTDKEAQALFNDISSALKDGDSNKLSTLTTEPTLDPDKLIEDPVIEETPEPESPDPLVEEEPTLELEDKDSPPEKADKEPSEKKELPVADDELAKLRAQLERVSKENHALKSQAGRVPHIQKRLREFDKKLEDLNKSQASPSSHPTTKISPQLDEILKGIKSTDPEYADAIKQAIVAATSGIVEESQAKERDTIKFFREQEALTYQQAEAQRLTDMYPNAAEVFASPHWNSWRESQSEGIKRLADSGDADDVALAFDKYAKDMVTQHPQLAAGSQKGPEANATDPKIAENAEKAKKVEEERLRKKQGAANVGSPAGAGKVSLPDDPEALFKKYSEQIRKERTGA